MPMLEDLNNRQQWRRMRDAIESGVFRGLCKFITLALAVFVALPALVLVIAMYLFNWKAPWQ